MSMFWVNDTPTTKAEDWKWSLQEPEKQWRPGYSAWALAHSWEDAQGFPPEIQHMLSPQFLNLTLTQGWVEYQVPMPGYGKASHNDLFVLANCLEGDLCIAIEGKVSEPLGPTIAEWHNRSVNRERRLAGILETIGLPRAIPETIRYQLLHRLASPVIAANVTFNVRHAVMIVHSFSEWDASFTDFAALLTLYGTNDARPGQLYLLKSIGDLKLYAGWARGDQQFLLGE
ncbi:MAG: hypothetical protein IPK19_14105 [Chloroflexi bacterium]|nr:hypothetical protein [Chloroflexota bacterium]